MKSINLSPLRVHTGRFTRRGYPLLTVKPLNIMLESHQRHLGVSVGIERIYKQWHKWKNEEGCHERLNLVVDILLESGPYYNLED